MTWAIFLDYLLKDLGSLAASIVVTYASILFTKLSGKLKDAKVIAFVKQAVRAAEQLYPNQGVKRGTEKYKYVVEQALAKFPSLTDNDYLKALIEGAVFELNNQLDQLEKNKIKNKKENKQKSEVIETNSNGNNSLSSF